MSDLGVSEAEPPAKVEYPPAKRSSRPKRARKMPDEEEETRKRPKQVTQRQITSKPNFKILFALDFLLHPVNREALVFPNMTLKLLYF